MRGLNRRQLTDYSDDLAALMKWTALIVLLALAVAFCGRANAGTVALTSDGKNPATLTWSTAPAASSCTGADGWSGTKAISGTEKLAAVTTTTKFTLNCTWPADDKASLSWVAPTTNTDGSSPASVSGYNVYQDDSASPALSTATKIAGGSSNVIRADQLTYTVTGLAAGAHNFAVQAWYCADTCAESALSAFVTKTNAAASTAAANVNVGPVAGTPNPPTGLTVLASATTAYDLIKSNDKLSVKAIGNSAIGTACDATQPVLSYYIVPRASVTLVGTTTKPQVVVAKCG